MRWALTRLSPAEEQSGPRGRPAWTSPVPPPQEQAPSHAPRRRDVPAARTPGPWARTRGGSRGRGASPCRGCPRADRACVCLDLQPHARGHRGERRRPRRPPHHRDQRAERGGHGPREDRAGPVQLGGGGEAQPPPPGVAVPRKPLVPAQEAARPRRAVPAGASAVSPLAACAPTPPSTGRAVSAPGECRDEDGAWLPWPQPQPAGRDAFRCPPRGPTLPPADPLGPGAGLQPPGCGSASCRPPPWSRRGRCSTRPHPGPSLALSGFRAAWQVRGADPRELTRVPWREGRSRALRTGPRPECECECVCVGAGFGDV